MNSRQLKRKLALFQIILMLILITFQGIYPVKLYGATQNPSPATTITIAPSQTIRDIPVELFGGIISFQDNGQGAMDPAKLNNTTGIGIFYPQYVQLLKNMGFTSLRFGDASPTADVYDWKRAIGPQSSRRYQRTRLGSPGIPATYGPDEFLQLCEAIGAKANWVYNSHRSDSAQDAANLLAYMTAPVSANPSSDPNDPSYWAALRAANGHPAPYTCLDYFDIGNEEEGAGSGWRAGTVVSVGAHTTTTTQDANNKDALYAFGGTTAFTKQAVIGYADTTTSSAISLGTPNQVFYAPCPPLVPSSDSVFVGNANNTNSDVQWMRVSSLATVGPSDQVYTIDNTTGKITFGDGTHGAIPTMNMQIKLSYQSGPHDGYVQYYTALKKVDPNIKVIAQDSNAGFQQLMSAYSCDGIAHHPLGVGFPRTNLAADEFEKEVLLAPLNQSTSESTLQQQIDTNMGRHVPLLLTAYGHSQGNQPSGDTENHLRLTDGLLAAGEVMAYQNIGITLAHIFLVNDKPYNPNPNEAPPARRWNGRIISNGTDPDFAVAPTGLAMGIVSKLAGMTQVGCSVTGNPEIPLASGASFPTLDTLNTMAAKDSAGNVSLVVVNQSLDTDQTAQINLSGYTHNSVAAVTTMDGASYTSINRLDVPPEVTTTSSSISLGLSNFSYNFPAHSITRIDLKADTTPTTTIAITPSKGGNVVNPELFGAVMNWTLNGEGACDPTTGIAYQPFVDTVKQLGITSIRYGGGTISATAFDWTRAIGPMSQRPMNRSRDGNPGQPSTFGPDELGNLLDRTGAKGDFILNNARMNAQDGADLVAYMTTPVSVNPSTDPKDQSYWAALRAKNGHPAPYNIDIVDVGNEEEMGKAGWRSGTVVSIGTHTTTCPDQAALYAFGGTTAFTKQPVVGYSDLSSAAAISTGTAGQDFYASYPPVVPSSQTVYVAGTAWSPITNLSSAGPTDKVYTIDNTTGKITFGDGTHGMIPSQGSQVTLSYQSGPHDGYVQFYQAIKKVNPNIAVASEYGDATFFQAMGATYPYDLATIHPLGTGFNFSGSLPVDEFERETLYAPVIQATTLSALQLQIKQYAGKNVPLTLTAYGQVQSNVPTGMPDFHLNLTQGLLEADELITYQNLGIPLAHRFLLNDTPYNPNTSDAPTARRYNAEIISNGTDSNFVATPNGLAQGIVSKLGRMTQIGTDVTGNPAIWIATGNSYPTLNTLAAQDSYGNVSLVVVNNDLNNDLSAQVDTSAYRHYNIATVTTLNGPSPTSINSLTQTNIVTSKTNSYDTGGGSFNYTFPAHSVTRIDFTGYTSSGSGNRSTATTPTTGTSGTTAPTTPTAPASPAVPGSALNRLSGSSRVDTALAIAKAVYPEKLESVVLADAYNFPDALVGGVFAYKQNAPILLVGNSTADQDKVIDFMKANMDAAGSVYILGGTGAVSPEMQAKLTNTGFNNITRLGGADRYETAVKIAENLNVAQGTPIFVVSGENFPDALSISSTAERLQNPIFIVSKDGISAAAQKEIASIKPSKVYLIGLQGVISPEVESQIAQTTSLDSSNIIRIGGADRYETSLAAAKYFDASEKNACIATGSDFADALAGSIYAAKTNSPMLLIDSTLTDAVKEYLSSKNITSITIFGGNSAVNKAIEDQMSQIISSKNK